MDVHPKVRFPAEICLGDPLRFTSSRPRHATMVATLGLFSVSLNTAQRQSQKSHSQMCRGTSDHQSSRSCTRWRTRTYSCRSVKRSPSSPLLPRIILSNDLNGLKLQAVHGARADASPALMMKKPLPSLPASMIRSPGSKETCLKAAATLGSSARGSCFLPRGINT